MPRTKVKTKKSSKKSVKVDNFQPEKVSLAVACLAGAVLVLFAVVAINGL